MRVRRNRDRGAGPEEDRGSEKHPRARISLARLVRRLRESHGLVEIPPATDPFELILRENVVYLADDAAREQAFSLLREEVGLSPRKILDAPREKLLAVARRGILAAAQVEKLRDAAAIALQRFQGDLVEVVRRPYAQAVRALQAFPGIGEPGAEKILLYARRHLSLAPDSNALRVLLRLGFGIEGRSYSASYRSVRTALELEVPPDFDRVLEARELLRRHGRRICKAARPRCEVCPLRSDCVFYARRSEGAPGRASARS